MTARRIPADASAWATRWIRIVLVASAVLGVSACGHSSSVQSTSGTESATAEGASNTADDLIAFCAAVTAPADAPEAYVGSPEHLAAVARLAAIAPPELRPQFEAYQGFLSSGGIDPARYESKLTTNWPAEIQNAIAEIKDYGAANC